MRRKRRPLTSYPRPFNGDSTRDIGESLDSNQEEKDHEKVVIQEEKNLTVGGPVSVCNCTQDCTQDSTAMAQSVNSIVETAFTLDFLSADVVLLLFYNLFTFDSSRLRHE